MKVPLVNMAKCVVILIIGLVVAVSADQTKLKSSGIYPRSINNLSRDRGGLGNPVEWTMSKANLVAEFYSSEPAPSIHSNNRDRSDRSQKSIFSFLTGNYNNGSREKNAYLPVVPPPQHMAPPPPRQMYQKQDKKGNENLIASGTAYNQQSTPFDIHRNNLNLPPAGGFSTQFRPINPNQQNFIFPSVGSPSSGYPHNLRPPRGPPPSPPPRQYIWDSRPINGLRPPLVGAAQQQQQQQYQSPPPPLYLPPQHSQSQPSQQQQQSQQSQRPPISALQLPNPQPQVQSPPQQSPQQSPPPPSPQYPVPAPKKNSSFTPSTQYLPTTEQKPEPNPPVALPQFQPGSPPPQIFETYSKQVKYPLLPGGQYSTEKPLVYVMANSSFDQSSNVNNPVKQNQYNPLNSYTQYENESVPPPPPSSLSLQQHQQSSSSAQHVQQQQQTNQQSIQQFQQQQQNNQQSIQQVQQQHQTNQQSIQQFQQQQQNNKQSSEQAQQQQQNNQQSSQQANLNTLALTEPLSHVLAEANAKAGEAMDKTIRFVIHKPEDEDIVRNAILEDAQNRYEDVKFVQGPTLKVQRKETVYLPPKKKTVVYILLKEPQIDTNVEVMSPQEDEPAPEVYITYQKSDGAVKTKHYSPKPIREEDMKKYLDIEEDSTYGAGEESRFHPRFSKSTSVSLSTSSKVSRKTASTSMSSSSDNKYVNGSENDVNNAALLANHKMPASSTNDTSSLTEMKSSPLLYTSRNINQIQISNSTSSVRLPQKKPRSSDFVPIIPSPRRLLRHYPIQCPTGT